MKTHGSVCNLDDCMTHDAFAHDKALLEYFHDGVVIAVFHLHVHHGIVQGGVEAVAGLAEDFHAQTGEDLHQLGHGQLHALFVGGILGGLVHGPLQDIVDGKQLGYRVGLAVAVGGFLLLDGALAEIIKPNLSGKRTEHYSQFRGGVFPSPGTGQWFVF